ncbi:MAG: hypothetical protein GC181_08245 [Bacteroidetes bacterium]|nr:hypothetical protein [Bacteroidota bacterium]
MNKTLFVVGLISISVFHASAQEKSFPIRNVYVSSGGSFFLGYNYTLDDYRSIVPQSSILKQDLSEFHMEDNLPGGAVNFSILAGIPIKSGNRPSRELRIGVNQQYSYSQGLLTVSDKYRLDTLHSDRTNSMFYIDSVHGQNIDFNHASEILQLDVSYIFRSNGVKRWSWFAGGGLRAGSSLRNRLSIDRWENDRIDISGNDVYGSNIWVFFNSKEIASETYNLKNFFALTAYIPLGVDFRIGNGAGLLHNTHLFVEGRPGLNVQLGTENGSRAFTNAGGQFGIRMSL